MTGKESTPLLQKNGDGNNFYFKKLQKEGSSYDSTTDADGGHVVETLPHGSSEEDFAPRALGESIKKQRRPSEPTGIFGKWFGGSKKNDANVSETRMIKPRKAPIKVEPKVFFANERTFLAWMHVSIILAGASVAILTLSDYENIEKQLYGLIMLPVAVAFLVYAMYQYVKRAHMLRNKLPGPYDDTVGPTVLSIMLMVSITAQFAIKMISSANRV
ncbi:unnamed protein product [Pseudo-nitzschia multistriata]|uniref:DUF202 domain-containing protein n=1 Tax=Pseudo-nitzschia multistriata TaxID=183589 RepID=A0A448YWB5_9STRA|nr:unnamed protein product [Pseudo-nitzschia multistriata]